MIEDTVGCASVVPVCCLWWIFCWDGDSWRCWVCRSDVNLQASVVSPRHSANPACQQKDSYEITYLTNECSFRLKLIDQAELVWPIQTMVSTPPLNWWAKLHPSEKLTSKSMQEGLGTPPKFNIHFSSCFVEGTHLSARSLRRESIRDMGFIEKHFSKRVISMFRYLKVASAAPQSRTQRRALNWRVVHPLKVHMSGMSIMSTLLLKKKWHVIQSRKIGLSICNVPVSVCRVSWTVWLLVV